MTTTIGFDLADLELLLTRYDTPDSAEQPRRPPWTWTALDRAERAALARMVEVFVSHYNHVHAITGKELIPPCWRRHPGLAAELAVQVWMWYYAHLDPKASPALASDYYGRHLPGFRSRLDRLLGVSPGECRRGEHPDTWRKDADKLLATYDQLPTDPAHDKHDVERLGEPHFGFPHLNDDGQR
ncbi:MAG: hypothetical protein ACRDRQ_14520 [Pseudonocardiaceae bacterium]